MIDLSLPGADPRPGMLIELRARRGLQRENLPAPGAEPVVSAPVVPATVIGVQPPQPPRPPTPPRVPIQIPVVVPAVLVRLRPPRRHLTLNPHRQVVLHAYLAPAPQFRVPAPSVPGRLLIHRPRGPQLTSGRFPIPLSHRAAGG